MKVTEEPIPIPLGWVSARQIAHHAGLPNVVPLLESGPDGSSWFAHEAGITWQYDRDYESWCSPEDAKKALTYIKEHFKENS